MSEPASTVPAREDAHDARLAAIVRSLTARFGEAILDDPKRLYAFLIDHAPEAGRQARLLRLAAVDGVPTVLLRTDARMRDIEVRRLAAAMEAAHATRPDLALWAVRFWANALAAPPLGSPQAPPPRAGGGAPPDEWRVPAPVAPWTEIVGAAAGPAPLPFPPVPPARRGTRTPLLAALLLVPLILGGLYLAGLVDWPAAFGGAESGEPPAARNQEAAASGPPSLPRFEPLAPGDTPRDPDGAPLAPGLPGSTAASRAGGAFPALQPGEPGDGAPGSLPTVPAETLDGVVRLDFSFPLDEGPVNMTLGFGASGGGLWSAGPPASAGEAMEFGTRSEPIPGVFREAEDGSRWLLLQSGWSQNALDLPRYCAAVRLGPGEGIAIDGEYFCVMSAGCEAAIACARMEAAADAR